MYVSSIDDFLAPPRGKGKTKRKKQRKLIPFFKIAVSDGRTNAKAICDLPEIDKRR